MLASTTRQRQTRQDGKKTRFAGWKRRPPRASSVCEAATVAPTLGRCQRPTQGFCRSCVYSRNLTSRLHHIASSIETFGHKPKSYLAALHYRSVNKISDLAEGIIASRCNYHLHLHGRAPHRGRGRQNSIRMGTCNNGTTWTTKKRCTTDNDEIKQTHQP